MEKPTYVAGGTWRKTSDQLLMVFKQAKHASARSKLGVLEIEGVEERAIS